MDRRGENEHDPPSGPMDLFDDSRVWELVTAFQQELKSGQQPDRSAYLNRYPELATTVAECLDGLQLLHGELSGSFLTSHKLSHEVLVESVLKPSTNLLGDFRIVGEIARGGMGIVYEAVQISLDRRVALKVLPFASTMDSRHLQRFKIEAQAAALLHHTHIVPIYAVGCERGVHFYAMQLIEGQSLAAVLQGLRLQEGRAAVRGASSKSKLQEFARDAQEEQVDVPPSASSEVLRSTANVSAVMTAGNALASEGYLRRAARLMIQAAEALEHAHQSGVVHRDVKPANLLIDRTGNLWVTDFGLAQLQSESGVTRSNDILGTFRYMSPEQTGGQRAVLDHRTDIYSLGATFYELVTLEPAFTASSHQELFYQILHTEPRRPRELNRAVPLELETIILKALSKNPPERYTTAADFAADLQRYLDHEPILARRPSSLERLRKWSRRHPSAVAAGMLLLAVVAVGSLIGNWLISNEQRKTADALRGQKLRAEEAEDRFDQARQAVDTLFQISEEELTDRSMEGARERILEVVLTHYEEFIEQRSGDEVSQAKLAQVQDKVKAILHELNVLQHAMDYRLLERSTVQKELDLSTMQAEQLKKLLAIWREAGRTFSKTMREATEAERRAGLVTIAEREELKLKALLTTEQLTRFRQIVIQSRGLAAFKDHDIIRALNLTAEQRSKIREIEREKFVERFHAPSPADRDSRPTPERLNDRGTQGPQPTRSSSSAEPREAWRQGRGPQEHDRGRQERGRGRPEKDRDPQEQTPMKVWIEKVLRSLTQEQVTKWQVLTGQPFAEFERDGFPRLPR